MSILIFDTETTGFGSPSEPAQIIEAAWLEIYPFCLPKVEVAGEYSERFKPSVPIEFGAMATHHIIPADLEGCQPSSSFALPDGVQYLIGHNIDFDWKMMGEPDVKRICTLALARMAWKGISHTQSALAYYLCEDKNQAREMVKNAHNALADIKICAFVLQHLINHFGVTSIEELYDLSERARIPTEMPFGKHKGKGIRYLVEFEGKYINWLLAQDNVDTYLLQAIDNAKEQIACEANEDLPF